MIASQHSFVGIDIQQTAEILGSLEPAKRPGTTTLTTESLLCGYKWLLLYIRVERPLCSVQCLLI